MPAPRRERDETRVFKRMGDALGWSRGTGTTANVSFPKENARYGSKAGNAAGEIPPHELNAFPGKGHVTTNRGEGFEGLKGIVKK